MVKFLQNKHSKSSDYLTYAESISTNIQKSIQNASYSGACSYGSYHMANVASFEYNFIKFILCASLATILFRNSSLHRFYKPLAYIVDITLLINMVSSSLYFTYHPYVSSGNCLELFLGRANRIIVMFGEMHQIYLLANILGLGTHRIPLLSFRNNSLTLSLENLLKLLLLSASITAILMFTVLKNYFRIMRGIWQIIVSFLQLYFISLAKYLPSHRRDHSIISTEDISIALFEKLSLLQIIPLICIVLRNVLALYDIVLVSPAEYLEGAMLILQEIVNLLFYLKALLVALSANIEVAIITK